MKQVLSSYKSITTVVLLIPYKYNRVIIVLNTLMLLTVHTLPNNDVLLK